MAFALLVPSGSALIGRDAAAQATDVAQEVRELNRVALADFTAGRTADALQALTKAEALCRENEIEGPLLSAVHVGLGIVESKANRNNGAAFERFVRALCQDPTAEVDAAYLDEDVRAVMDLAAAQAAAPGACDREFAGQPTVKPGDEGAAAGMPAAELLRHAPVTEQGKLVPLPVYVEVNPKVEVGGVRLYYRAAGTAIFDAISMSPHGRGWSATVGCDVLEVLGPTSLEYFVAVLDGDGKLVGTWGSRARPQVVQAVDAVKGPAPSLPGEAAPARCELQCPQDNPECSADCKGAGELCDTDAECCGSMVCQGFMCKPKTGAAITGFVKGKKPLFTAAVVAGTGFGVVPGDTMTVKDVKPNHEVSYDTSVYFNRFHFRAGALFFLYQVPGLKVGATFRGDLTFDSPAFGPAGLLNVSYKLFGLADERGLDRLDLHFLGGLGGGVIYHEVEYTDCKSTVAHNDSEHGAYSDFGEGNGAPVTLCEWGVVEVNDQGDWVYNPDLNPDLTVTRDYFRAAGYFIIEAGVEGNYWFTDNLGINAGIVLDAMVPDFALNVDIQAGLAMRF